MCSNLCVNTIIRPATFVGNGDTCLCSFTMSTHVRPSVLNYYVANVVSRFVNFKKYCIQISRPKRPPGTNDVCQLLP